MPLRASDADRDALAQDLRAHFAAGRLNDDELSERIDAAYGARTTEELAALRDDLPDARPLPAAPAPRELARTRVYRDAGGVVLLNALCITVWLASGAHGQFWPVWVMIASGFRLAQDAWRLLGPGPPAPLRPRRSARR